MVEYAMQLDLIFNSLSDPTRRDILERLQHTTLNIGEIAELYDMSLAAVSKHLKILEKARLIIKRKAGRERYVSLAPQAMQQTARYFTQYEALWNQRFDRLETVVEEDLWTNQSL
jgi:DNA-binding transcriptional ArsR family regulator